MNYYNEFDPGAAAWLRELIKEGHIPRGYVDDRSISEVVASDLAGFTQCHFFAGIGGWSYALKLAGIPATTKLWTGSPPCQPFSTAGKQLGQLDERHLAPTFMRLVDQCRPPVLFGEQVAAAIGKHWLDDLFDELERQGYACGAAVLPACSVGAPHKRDRLFFGAASGLGNTNMLKYDTFNVRAIPATKLPMCFEERETDGYAIANASSPDIMADTSGERSQGRLPRRQDSQREVEHGSTGRDCTAITTRANNGFWSDVDWIGCRDGKFRPVISSFIALVDGFSDSLGCGGYPRVRESSEMFKLPEGVSAEAFFFGRTGKPVNAEATEVLRSEVHGKRARRTSGVDASKLSQTVGEDFNRGLYELSEENREDARASQGREPFKQRAIELDDIMCELSQQSTFAELQQRNYEAQALCALRDACAEKWSVQHSFVAVESVWSSFSEEDKARERVDFNAGIWRRVEFFPLSSGEEGRGARLRGYGNAIVPQVAAEFIKAFYGAIKDATN